MQRTDRTFPLFQVEQFVSNLPDGDVRGFAWAVVNIVSYCVHDAGGASKQLNAIHYKVGDLHDRQTGRGQLSDDLLIVVGLLPPQSDEVRAVVYDFTHR